MFRGMRGTANSDRSFWSKPIDAEAGWMDDLSTEPVDTVDAAETHALDEFAAGRHGPTDRFLQHPDSRAETVDLLERHRPDAESDHRLDDP